MVLYKNMVLYQAATVSGGYISLRTYQLYAPPPPVQG